MRNAVIIICCLLISVAVKAQPDTLKWGKSWGNANINDQGNSVCVDINGNVFSTGTFRGTIYFNLGQDTTFLTSTGNYSAFITKFDAAGNFIWAKSFGGASATSKTYPVTIKTDESGNVITAGTFFQTVDFDPSEVVYNLSSMSGNGGIQNLPAPSIFIQKLDSNGNFIWVFRIGANSATSAGSGTVNQITVDGDNNVYLTGGINQNGTLDFDSNPNDNVHANDQTGKAFLAKYDSAANLSWVKTFGNPYNASSNAICLTNSNLYVAGTTNYSNGSIARLMVRKFDLSGTGIWEKLVAAPHSVLGYSIAVDDESNVITTGYFDDPAVDFDPGSGSFILSDANGHAFIQKLDADGHFVWAKNFFTAMGSVAINPDNSILVSGYFSGTVDFDFAEPVFNLTTSGNAGFIQKLDANGYLLWAGQFANSGNGVVRGLATDSLRNIYLTGNYSGTQDFDPDPSPAQVSNFTSVSGSRDAFILKLKDPQAYITVKDGNWNVGSTWRGGVVPPTDAAVIVRHVVVVTENAGCYSLLVEKGGASVTVNTGLNLTVNH